MKLAVFRVDSGITTGQGHLGRCVILAQELIKNGYRVVFVSRRYPTSVSVTDLDSRISELWIDRPHEFLNEQIWGEVEQTHDADFIRQSFHADQIALLVVDHYGLDHRFESRVPAEKTLVIDDLFNRTHDADWILNTALENPGQYANLCLRPYLELLGPSFALVSSAVRESRERYDLKITTENLVYFGGGSWGAETLETLETLKELNAGPTHFILNPHAPEFPELKRRADLIPGFKTSPPVSDFAGLLQKTRLFIGSSGATTWDRSSVGVPSIVFTAAPNQEGIATLVESKQAAVTLGELSSVNIRRKLPEAYRRLADFTALETISIQARQLCDGQGAQRIVAEISKEPVRNSRN